jgi:hypothetical protein
MQRLSRLPAAPHIGRLLRGKPNPSPFLSHKHHLWKIDSYQMVLQRQVELAPTPGNDSLTRHFMVEKPIWRA